MMAIAIVYPTLHTFSYTGYACGRVDFLVQLKSPLPASPVQVTPSEVALSIPAHSQCSLLNFHTVNNLSPLDPHSTALHCSLAFNVHFCSLKMCNLFQLVLIRVNSKSM